MLPFGAINEKGLYVVQFSAARGGRPAPADRNAEKRFCAAGDERYAVVLPSEAGRPAAARGLSVDTLLRAFYQPMFDIARLVQTSAVESSLDVSTDVELGKDQWRLCCELPTLLEKLWADLYEQRRTVPASLRRAKTAEAALVDGCMHVLKNMDQVALLIAERLAGQFMHRLVFLHDKLDESGSSVLSGDVGTSQRIAWLWRQQRNRESLARYFEAQMGEQLPRACGAGAAGFPAERGGRCPRCGLAGDSAAVWVAGIIVGPACCPNACICP